MKTETVLWIAGGLVVAYVAYKSYEGAKALIQDVNPVNPNNVFYSGVNSAGAAISGNSSFSLGSWIYSLVHPSYNPNTPSTTGAVTVPGPSM